MEAHRIKAARRSLWRIWVFAGLLWSTFFLLIAAGIVWLFGIPVAETVQLALTLALVTCGGVYGFIYLGALVLAVVKRVMGHTGI